MTFPRRVFRIAGWCGVLAVAPCFVLEAVLSRIMPPEFSHPEFYYGFVGLVLAFQWAYLVIGSDPPRYRPLMPVAALAKGSFVATVLLLALAGRVAPVACAIVMPDLVFALLFLYAFRVTPNAPRADLP